MSRTKNILLVLVLAVIISANWYVVCYAEITFENGKWETTFDCDEARQYEFTLVCDGLDWGGGWTFHKYILADGIANDWTISSVGTNEYYYTGSLLAVEPSEVYASLTQMNAGTIGVLAVDQKAWGDNDSIGSSTTYIRTSSGADPDTLDDVYALVNHPAPAYYEEGDYATWILNSANYPAGLGGNGASFFLGNGNTALTTGHITAEFPSAQTEFWVRWYVKYENGFKWNPLNIHKMLYMYTASGGTQVIPEFQAADTYLLNIQGGPATDQVRSLIGWESTMGGTTSDGEWHSYEIHIKMDTDTTDGVGQVWIDGVLGISVTDVNFSNDIEVAKLGWEYFYIFSNSIEPFNDAGAGAVDYDDMVVYNTTPPGDCDGIPCIGPIGATPSTPTGNMVGASTNSGGIE